MHCAVHNMHNVQNERPATALSAQSTPLARFYDIYFL